MSIDYDQYELDIDRRSRRDIKPGRRLFRYAMPFKKSLILALIMLLIAVGTDVAGPLVAKRIIDEHIAGIEKPWHVASVDDSYAVSRNGTLYKRADRFAEGEEQGAEVRILQIENRFYWVSQPIEFDGHRSYAEDGIVRITAEDGTVAEYAAERLSTREVLPFFMTELNGVLLLCLFYFGLIIISAIFSYGQRYYLQYAANRIIRNIRTQVFAQIHRLPIRYFDNLPAGKVVSRITNDTETIRDLYVTVLANIFSGTVTMAGILGMLFLLDVRLALICLFIIPVLGLWIYIYRKFARRYNRVIRSEVSEMNGMINESIQGMSLIQAFRKEEQVFNEFEQHNERHFNFRNKMLNLNTLTGFNLIGVVRNIALISMVWYFGGIRLSGVEGVITVGVLYAFVDYLNRLFQPVVNIINQLPNLETAIVSAERVFVLMDEEGEDVSEEKIPRYKGDVAFRDVWFAYKEDEYVLKGIDFEAKQGQTVALVGHTGSGKSSIINLLFRFYDVHKGSITIDGVDTRDIPRQAMREHMGIVLQDPFLFTGTIMSNVTLGDPSITREQVIQALKEVGAERMLQRLSRGIDEPVNENGGTLSAGERQLISFARALVFNPAILILDEATSNIDTETEAIIQEALEVVKKGRTTFIIAHRLSTIKNADLILVLDRGEIMERGNHEQLMAKRGRYYQMYQLQSGELHSYSGTAG
jgi:ATP-binding cassette subfamily B protein